MRTLLLTVLVSFNLVACVAGDNDSIDQGDELSAIDGDDNLAAMPGSKQKEVRSPAEAGTGVQGDLAFSQRDPSMDVHGDLSKQNFDLQGNSDDVQAPKQAGMDVQGKIGEQNFDVQGDSRDVGAQGKPGLDVQGKIGKQNFDVQGDRYDVEQAKLYNPSGIEEVDLIKILRGVR